MNILVCDDDIEIVEAIEVYLKNEGYNILKCYSGLEAIDTVEKNDVHLVIMDIMMPGMDGIKATTKIREIKNIPVIMVTAKSEESDIVLGLNMGADDYITKPFNPLELTARVKSQLRRYTTLGGATEKDKKDYYKTGNLLIDDERKEVTVDGEQVKLTPVEYKILLFLTKNKGRVFSIDDIYESVWNEPSFNPENTVAVHIRRIREKVEIDPKNPRYLKVVWGVGYKVEDI
ncbi:Transcriptional regulatory protein SrrA [bioreactor metagenome]|jgi:DNA-binding response OmpR family regulator|uniref:DNA-binding response OmpR family regulator n=2 Tax=root TaxID=1 RepID=A0A562J8W9_9FIRM|nr:MULTISPECIES: response regulator transcription factor [Sedimentibacter]MEA5093446.1 response regulator transcription factor [Sedimentibacter saalensis]TWH79335.1 DNA-binding response OmpR family regulator [Sedimentibacter saalensis]